MPAKIDWVCASCHHKQKKPKPTLVTRNGKAMVCSNCGSEDVFFMNDGSWPCPTCNEPKLNYAACQKGKNCPECAKQYGTYT
jgi:hypothetical protein